MEQSIYYVEFSRYPGCEFCAQRRWQVLFVGALLAAVAAMCDAARFSITTDTEGLSLASTPVDLLWAFPQNGISVVITAATPENAESATNVPAQDLAKHTDLFL